MSWDTIAFDVDDRGVATITVDRPEQLNALTAETLEAIEDALDEAAERDARVLVIAGAGDEAFVAGADISHMVDLSTPEAQAYAELGHRVADAIETFPAPTIAAVDGYAFGGGCELALACDMRVAAESAVLGQTEIDLGIIPGWGGTQRLPALVGDEVARRLIFLGERIDAAEAAEVGFVGEVVADEAFVAGADISHMVDLSTPEAQAYAELGHRVADAIETFPAPTIAAVDGYAFGGGCELALACDLRVAAESAVLGQTEIDLGIIPGWGGTQRLPALVGDEVARRLIFLGERIDATEAAEVGFVGEVVADDDFEDRIDDLAGELAAKPTTALRAAKEALNAASEGSAATGLALERRAWAGLFGTHDQREGMTAFLEKRDPEFE